MMKRNHSRRAAAVAGALFSILAVACGNGGGREGSRAEAETKPAPEKPGQTAALSFRIDGMRRVNGAL